MSLPEKLPTPTILQREEEVATIWRHTAPHGVTLDQVMEPDYWHHIGAKLLRTPNRGQWDQIRVVAEDGAYEALLTIIAVDPRGLWVETRPVHVWQGKALPKAEPDKDGFKVEFSGPQKWRIIDRAGEVVARDLPDEAVAYEVLATVKAKAKKAA